MKSKEIKKITSIILSVMMAITFAGIRSLTVLAEDVTSNTVVTDNINSDTGGLIAGGEGQVSTGEGNTQVDIGTGGTGSTGGNSTSNDLVTGGSGNISTDGGTTSGDIVITGGTTPTEPTVAQEGGFNYTENGTSITIIGYSGTSGDVVIPETINGKSVTTIGEEAFYNNDTITSISMPSVTTIGDSAFYNCTALTNIEVSKEITTVGEQAFGYCESLKNFTINYGTENIGNVTLEQWNTFVSDKIGINVESVTGKYVRNDEYIQNTGDRIILEMNTGIVKSYFGAGRDIVIPGNIGGYEVKAIGDYAFYMNNSIRTVILPDSVTSIGDYAFAFCSDKLTTIEMPQVTTIGKQAFAICHSLENVKMPQVTTLENEAFVNCSNLKNIEMPQLTSIGMGAFGGCSSFTDVVLPKATTIGDRAFLGDSSLINVEIPKTVDIGDEVFGNCGKFAKLTIYYGTEDISNVTLEQWNEFALKLSGLNTNNVTGKFAKNNEYTKDLNDTVGPVIKIGDTVINGDTAIELKEGSSYAEIATAYDEYEKKDVTVVSQIKFDGAVVENVDTSKVGTYTITYTAMDSSRNLSTATRTVNVTYSYSGILQPINNDNTSVFKAGRTVPVKFQLKDAKGAYVSTAIAKLSYARITNNVVGVVNEAESTSAATTGNLFRYDATSNQYIFNLSTKGLTVGTYKLIIELDDGKKYDVEIGLR